MTVHNRGENGPIKLSARQGQLSLEAETQTLLLKVVDSRVEGGHVFHTDFPGESEYRIPLSKQMAKKDTSSQSPSELPLRLISSERIRQDSRTHAAVGKMAALHWLFDPDVAMRGHCREFGASHRTNAGDKANVG